MHRIASLLRKYPLASSIVVCANCALPTSPLRAQSLRVLVSDSATGSPLSGAVVSLTLGSGDSVRAAITDKLGSAHIPLKRGGQYRLSVRRIGYSPMRGLSIEIAPTGETVFRNAMRSLASVVATLDGVSVKGSTSCSTLRDESLSRQWGRVRVALDALVAAEANRAIQVTAERIERERDSNGVVRYQRISRTTGTSSRPFVSAPLEEIEKRGFVWTNRDTTVWNAPDANVLISDGFVSGHCLAGGEGRRLSSNDQTLVFEPNNRPASADVKVSLVVDSARAIPRALSFEYVWPRSVAFVGPLASKLGGQLQFEELPNGLLVVRKWNLTIPRIVKLLSSFPLQGRDRSGAGVDRSYAIATVQEFEGSLTEIRGLDGELFSKESNSEIADIHGTVFDSLANRPLSNAQVWLIGIDRPVKTDNGGRFVLDSVRPGRYVITFASPATDSLGISPPEQVLQVQAAARTVVSFAIPSGTTLYRRLCAESRSDPQQVLALRGQVQLSSGEFVPEGTVTASWQKFDKRESSLDVRPITINAPIDDRGWFTLCDIERARNITLSAVYEGASATLVVRTESQSAIQVQDLILSEPDQRVATLPQVNSSARSATRSAAGSTIYADEISKRGIRTVADAIKTLSGVDVRFDSSNRPQAVGRRGKVGDLLGRKSAVDCPMTIVVDNSILSVDGSLEGAPEITAIARILVQPGVAAAAQNVAQNGCGVVQIWTKLQ